MGKKCTVREKNCNEKLRINKILRQILKKSKSANRRKVYRKRRIFLVPKDFFKNFGTLVGGHVSEWSPAVQLQLFCWVFLRWDIIIIILHQFSTIQLFTISGNLEIHASDWKSVERFSTDSFPESELVSAISAFCEFVDFSAEDPKINWCCRWSSSYAPGFSKTTLYLLLTTRSRRTPTANLAHRAVGYSTIAQ